MVLEDPRIAHLRIAWPALVRAARTAHLYTVAHSLVQRLLSDAIGRLRLATGAGGMARVELHSGRVDWHGIDLGAPDTPPDPLVVRLEQEGLLSIAFDTSIDLGTLGRFVERLSDFCGTEHGSAAGAVLRLRSERFEGLSIQWAQEAGEPADTPPLAIDRVDAWARWVVDPGPPGELHPDALLPVWDGGGALIPWPTPLDPADSELLDEQVQACAEEGVPLARIGTLLADALEHLAEAPAGQDALGALDGAVEALLSEERIPELRPLLEPASRWAETLSDTHPVGSGVRAVVASLLDERAWSRIAAAFQSGRCTDDDLRTVLLLQPVLAVPRLFELAAAEVRGPLRQAVTEGAVDLAGPDQLGLAEVLVQGSLGAALIALDHVAAQTLSRLTVRLLVAGLERPEPVARARALRALWPVRSAVVGRRVTTWVLDHNRDVRRAAMAWVGRHRWDAAAAPLRTFVTAAQFDAMPLPDRLEAARAFGAVGGEDAVTVALLKLRGAWEVQDPSLSLPWVACLAETGDDEAEPALDHLMRHAGPRLLPVVSELHGAWQQRRSAGVDSGEDAP